jgi:hypothetical protein
MLIEKGQPLATPVQYLEFYGWSQWRSRRQSLRPPDLTVRDIRTRAWRLQPHPGCALCLWAAPRWTSIGAEAPWRERLEDAGCRKSPDRNGILPGHGLGESGLSWYHTVYGCDRREAPLGDLSRALSRCRCCVSPAALPSVRGAGILCLLPGDVGRSWRSASRRVATRRDHTPLLPWSVDRSSY